MTKAVAAILQVAGLAAITVGAGLVCVPAGLIVGGALAVLFGVAVER